MIKALKKHIPPLDYKYIFEDLKTQYYFCKKDHLWSPDKLVLRDQGYGEKKGQLSVQ